MTYGDNTMSPTKRREQNDTFGNLERDPALSELRINASFINRLKYYLVHHAPHWACA